MHCNITSSENRKTKIRRVIFVDSVSYLNAFIAIWKHVKCLVRDVSIPRSYACDQDGYDIPSKHLCTPSASVSSKTRLVDYSPVHGKSIKRLVASLRSERYSSLHTLITRNIVGRVNTDDGTWGKFHVVKWTLIGPCRGL